MVSLIRRIPGLKWFFQQPQSVINAQEEPIDVDEAESLNPKDLELGLTAGGRYRHHLGSLSIPILLFYFYAKY